MTMIRSAMPGPAAVAENPATDHPHLWLADDGRPIRLVWAGRRWRVVDEPTRIGTVGADWPLTHPLAEWQGWRLTARADDGSGDSRVFDVMEAPGGGWRLLHAWR